MNEQIPAHILARIEPPEKGRPIYIPIQDLKGVLYRKAEGRFIDQRIDSDESVKVGQTSEVHGVIAIVEETVFSRYFGVAGVEHEAVISFYEKI